MTSGATMRRLVVSAVAQLVDCRAHDLTSFCIAKRHARLPRRDQASLLFVERVAIHVSLGLTRRETTDNRYDQYETIRHSHTVDAAWRYIYRAMDQPARVARMFRWFRRQLIAARRTSPAHYEPEAVRETFEQVQRLFGDGRYFGLQANLEAMPSAPAMIVMNHSGGTTIPDVWGFGVAWYRQFGFEEPRVLHCAAHDFILATDTTRRFFSRRGVLRGSRKLAVEVLRDWRRDLLVMPGGDMDTWRPYKERYSVRFNGRTGYARIALRCGVPIVPVAHAGAHETLIVLDDGQWLARALGIKRLTRANIWPVHLSLPWGLAVGPWPHIPWPATLRYNVGPAIRLDDEPIESPTPLQVDELDRRVREAIQLQLHELRDKG